METHKYREVTRLNRCNSPLWIMYELKCNSYYGSGRDQLR